MEEEETPVQSEDGESPVIFPGEEGSGYEGSGYFTDFATAAETGSGEAWTADFLQKGTLMVKDWDSLFYFSVVHVSLPVLVIFCSQMKK